MDLEKMYPNMAQDNPAPRADAADAALAAKFYPNSHPPEKAASRPAPESPQATPEPAGAPVLSEEARAEASGERLFNKAPEPFVDVNAPEEVKALRDADGARKMFSAQETYKTDLPLADFEAVVGQEGPDGVPFTQEQAVQAAGVWREVVADLELAPADVRELVPIFKAPPPTPEVQAANRTAAMKWLVAAHGDRAGFALEAARALIARDPRTAALLDHSGAGDDVRVVRKIVGAAMRQVQSGKLKVPKK